MNTSTPGPNDRFGVNLQRARQNTELSQEELAHKAGLHAKSISRYERGLREVGLITAIRLATVLKVDVAELCEGIRWDTRKREIRLDPPEPRPDET